MDFMLDIVPRVPGFSERLGASLGEGIGQGFSEAIESGKKRRQQALERDKLEKSFNNVMRIWQNPNISEDQKILGTYELLSQNPSLAHHLLGDIRQGQRSFGERLAGDRLSQGYSAILEGDDGGFKEIISDPKTPTSTKRELTRLHQEHQRRTDVGRREKRQRVNTVHSAYAKSIKEAEAQLPKVKYSERADVQKRIDQLKKSRDRDLKRLKKDPNAYEDLDIWTGGASDFFEPADEMDLEVLDAAPEREDAEAVEQLLNSLTDEQIAELVQASGGDLERAKAMVLERFGR